jgi:3-hydroxyacyl-[acyl-carrier-protein] dehydratase
MTYETVLDTKQILDILPHRYPFLLVDKVVEFEPGKRIVGIKNVTVNEEFFQGHFPSRPVMPGVLMLEAMAQCCAIMSRMSPNGTAPDKQIFIVGANDVKWKKVVVPGDTLKIEAKFIKKKGPLWLCEAECTVDEKMAAKATISAMEVD